MLAGGLGSFAGDQLTRSPTQPYSHQVTCKGCTLAVDGQLILDAWQSALAAKGATQQSGCVTFRTAGVKRIQVNFAGSNLADAPLQLHWAPCSTPSQWTLVPAADAAAWAPAAAVTGWIGGMQCDVWRGPLVPSSPPPTAPAPLFKVRLPAALAATNPVNAVLTAAFPASLQAMLPGLAAVYPPIGPQRFSLRCWTFTSAAFEGKSLTMEPAGTRSTAFLGHAQVWAGGAATPLPAWRAATAGGGEVARPLVLEWRDLTATQRLVVLVGGAPLTLSSAAMRLPLPVLPTADPKQLGARGHFSRAYAPAAAPPDVPGLIAFDASAFTARGAYENSSAGLDVAVKAYTNVPTGSVRYAVAAGYFKSPATQQGSLALARLTWSTPAKQGAALVVGGAGGVAIRNGAGFGARLGAVAADEVYSYEFYAPPGLMRLTAVVKSQASGQGAVFLSAASSSTAGAVVLNGANWVRAVDQRMQV